MSRRSGSGTGSDTEPIVEARGLTRTFRVRDGARRRTVTAVDDLTCVVEPGEAVGYIGANGAGKSTTIKMLTGILVPTSGEVRTCGLRPGARPHAGIARQVGVVFGQRSQLWWDLPARESFAILAAIHRLDPAAAARPARAELVEQLELGDFLATPVRQLSLGQRMRAEVAAALLHRPRLVILDEPTIGLDVLSQAAAAGVPRRRAARARHDAAAHHPRHGRRRAPLRPGRCVVDRGPARLRRRPAGLVAHRGRPAGAGRGPGRARSPTWAGRRRDQPPRQRGRRAAAAARPSTPSGPRRPPLLAAVARRAEVLDLADRGARHRGRRAARSTPRGAEPATRPPREGVGAGRRAEPRSGHVDCHRGLARGPRPAARAARATTSARSPSSAGPTWARPSTGRRLVRRDRPRQRPSGAGDRRGGRRRAEFTFDELRPPLRPGRQLVAAQGVAAATRVIVMLGNQVELWESMLAVMKLGAVIMPTTTARRPGRARRPDRPRAARGT